MRFRIIAALIGYGILSASAGGAQNSPAQGQPEISSQEAPVTFSSRVNLVSVPVVVRDREGRAVGNLRQENFQLFDKGKLQTITKFTVGKTGAPSLPEVTSVETGTDGNLRPKPLGAPTAQPIARTFLAWVFDDVHLPFSDLVQARAAVLRLLKDPLDPGTRAAVFTTSGHVTLDFTDNRDKLTQALNEIRPFPIVGGSDIDCPAISYYQADRIQNLNDPEARLAAEVAYVVKCYGPPGLTQRDVAVAMQEAHQAVKALVPRAIILGSHATEANLSILKELIRRMAAMPGTRSIVLVSPGFFLRDDRHEEATDLMDRALRASVVINSFSTQGVSAVTPGGNADTPPGLPIEVKQEFERKRAYADEGIMQDLADATGGTFFHNDNDYFAGFRRLAEQPEYIYILGFSPQNLKLDGSFHALKVTVRNVSSPTVQARRGYWAPNQAADAAEAAKEELREQVFSRDEIHDIPMDLHTEFFKSSEEKAELTVSALLNPDNLRFQKTAERNDDTVTVVTGIFDGNGNYVSGIQRVVQLHLRDQTLTALRDAGINVEETFTLPPGRYLVRVVVKDAGGQTTAARNEGVEIP